MDDVIRNRFLFTEHDTGKIHRPYFVFDRVFAHWIFNALWICMSTPLCCIPVCGWCVQFYKIKLCLFIIRNVTISGTHTHTRIHTSHHVCSQRVMRFDICHEDIILTLKHTYIVAFHCLTVSVTSSYTQTHANALPCLFLRVKALYT